MDSNRGEMKDLADKRSRLEQEFMERYLTTVERYQQDLEALRVSDAEDYHILKIRSGRVREEGGGEGSQYWSPTANILGVAWLASPRVLWFDVERYLSFPYPLPCPLPPRLETDIQNLEQHLEAMRATYQLNTEKLEYNYRVLVERDHENQATINQQKRKISRQRDVLLALKQKYAGQSEPHSP